MSSDDFIPPTGRQWPCAMGSCPPGVRSSGPVVEPDGQDGHAGHEDWYLGLLETEEGTPAPSWLASIQRYCRLNSDDEAFLRMRLMGWSAEQEERKAQAYIEAWQAASQAEPSAIHRENAGRLAANLTLPPLQPHETMKLKAISMRLSGSWLGYTEVK